MSVVSPALTSLPVKSKLALIRNVAHCPNSQFRFPPSLLDTWIFLIVSTNLPLTVTPGVSADVLVRPRVKRTVNKARINVKILIFFLLSILSSPFSIKILFPRNNMVKLVEICIGSVRSPTPQIESWERPKYICFSKENILVLKLFPTRGIIAKIMSSFKLKLMKWGRNYELLRDFINFCSLFENNHENANRFTKKKDGKVSFYW